jgi:hypothetical protein
VAAFWEGTNAVQGGTGKAEDGKLTGAGIIPKPCPRKGAAEMEQSSNRQDKVATGAPEEAASMAMEG